ncbi:MAG: antitoxin Xre/MbcA/ParS toxin-binding domain-containing protein [Syntrophales bacterium]
MGNMTPLSFLETDVGIEAVLNELGRIEHGIIP